MEEIVYKLETFEGPLDLLVSLISKKKMDIRDIKISEICDQYMEYIETAQKLDMDLAGEFLVMAADLMLLKSRSLLPREEKAAKEEFIQKIMAYQAAQEAAKDLSEKESVYKGRFEKEMDEFKPVISEKFRLDPNELVKALHNVFVRLEEETANRKLRENPNIPITKIKMKSMEQSCSELKSFMKKRGAVHFDNIFEEAKTLEDVITTFCAMLELIKTNVLYMERRTEGVYSDNNIVLRYNEEKELETEEEQNQELD